MKKKNIKLFGFILIFLFTFITISFILNISEIPATDYMKSDKDANIDKKNEEIIVEKKIKEDTPKTSNSFESSLNFSFNTRIVEVANDSWSYIKYNVTEGVFGKGTDIMVQEAYNGSNSSFEFYITDLINASSPTKDTLRPNDIGPMNYLSYEGKPEPSWEIFAINDDGPGKGNSSGYVHLNDTTPFGASAVIYTYDGITNITYNATLLLINAISNKTEKATFIPSIENTQSDFIEWEIQFDNKYFYDFYGQWQRLPDEYKAIIELDNIFTFSSALGRSGMYWNPLNYDRNSTHLMIYGSYEEYKINFYSPNLISATYNDNLTIPHIYTKEGKNELHLNVTCKMAGNLTIRFTDTNGTIFKEQYNNVEEDEIISSNYKMRNHSRGGTGYLNITLVNGSNMYFGVKLAEIAFHKRSLILGFTDNTTVFEPNFFLGAFVLDQDYCNYLEQKFGWYLGSPQTFEVVNLTMIHNATVTYELYDYSGELPFIWHPAPNINSWIWLTTIDLRELQIPPDEYNITFTASKPGYDTAVQIVKPFMVYKRNVTIDLQTTDDILEIEQSFSFTMNLVVNYTYDNGFVYMQENYLRIPVQVNLSFVNNETGKIDGPYPWGYNIVQSFSLYGQIENTTIPGIYYINVTIVSDYYQGSAAFPVEIIQKELEISVEYSGIIKESINTNFTWNLEEGNFVGNRENMTLEILIDNISTKNISLISNSSGYNLFSFTPGIHNITYRLISPFYYAEETIEFTVQALPPPADDDDDDDDDKEENIILLMIITLILIGVSILAIFMVISRHKVKAQRELESELIALKTKTAATEQKISLVETQISEIASIYWVLVVHSEQGVTMVEIADFKFENVIGEEQKELIGKGMLRDSALIGGFLTAIRNFSRETSGTSLESQPVFNSQTDYSTIVNDNEIHRRILEGSHYFMAFVSSRGTMEISDILSFINSKFELAYGEAVKNFEGAISPFRPFEDVVVEYLHKEIKELQKKLIEERLELEQHERHLREVQEKIGIKPKKLK